ncbi:MAG: protease modulator HflK, partial [OM182 bacterium]|nr:protease modulator HflK [OM182 bacterium]
VIARATGESDRFTALLNEYLKAPDITRERLYLDTIEEVYGKSSKVLLDVEGGNNMIYLPLDQLRQSQASGAAATDLKAGAVSSMSQTDVSNLTDQILREIDRRRSNQ